MHDRQMAGWGALGFASCVTTINIVENVVTGRPDPSADPVQIADWANGADAHLWVSTALFPLAGIPLAMLVVGILRLVRSAGLDTSPVLFGALGTAMMMGTLSTAIVADAVLITYVDDLSLEMVQVLSGLSVAVFVFNWAPLALALYGLSRAAASIGLLPGWLNRITLIGAALLVAGSTQAALPLDGTIPGLLLGLAGFVTWLIFLIAIGTQLVRGHEPHPTAA